jgi:acyl-CoA thioester hydrolase
MKAKIYYHHTDCGQVVYYATYLEFLEKARTEFLAEKGIDVKKLMEEGNFFVVSRQELDYKAPVRYADVIEIETVISEVSAVRISLSHKIKKSTGVLAVEARTVLAFVDKNFKPRAIPDHLRDKLT